MVLKEAIKLLNGVRAHKEKSRSKDGRNRFARMEISVFHLQKKIMSYSADIITQDPYL